MSESPLGEKGLADKHPVIARSEATRPGGRGIWSLLVTDELVEAAQEWSPLVRFRFERLGDGRVEMWMQRVETP